MKKKKNRLLAFSRSSNITRRLVIEICIGFFIVFSTLYLFLRVANSLATPETITFDTVITQIIYSLRSPAMTNLMQAITSLGGQDYIGIASILTFFFLFYKGYIKDALIFSFIILSTIQLNLLLKLFFQRPRPTLLPLVHEPTYSFPSGHSMISFVFFTCLSFFVLRKIKNTTLKITLILLSIVIIILVGLSRIYLGAHFPSDVVGGYLIGLFWFVLVLLFEKMIIFFDLFKKYELKKKY